MSGFSGEKSSRCSDGENICHEGPEKGRVSHRTPASPSTSFCDVNLYFYKAFLHSSSSLVSSPVFLPFRLRLFAMPKTRPTREQSGRSWRRWDTRSLWICCTRSRLGGSSTSYWSIWVVRHPVFIVLNLVRNKRQALNYPCAFVFTRRGSVYAARKRRHLHGGYRLVRSKKTYIKMWYFISVTVTVDWNLCFKICVQFLSRGDHVGLRSPSL